MMPRLTSSRPETDAAGLFGLVDGTSPTADAVGEQPWTLHPRCTVSFAVMTAIFI